MGCDIHVYTECKLPDGKWWCCDHFKLNPYYEKDDTYTREREWIVEPIFSDRNYTLFATLADVRNSGDVTPIDDPRGLPVDVSKKVKEESEWWGADGHSHSWFLASELFAYKAKRPFYKVTGMISSTDAFYLDEFGTIPKEWCRWTSDKSYVQRSWLVPYSVLDGLVDAIKGRMAEEFWIWDFLSEEEKEKKYNDNAKNFRIVFWFDN